MCRKFLSLARGYYVGSRMVGQPRWKSLAFAIGATVMVAVHGLRDRIGDDGQE